MRNLLRISLVLLVAFLVAIVGGFSDLENVGAFASMFGFMPLRFRAQETVGRKKPTRARRAVPFVEFTAAAHEHVEPAFDVNIAPPYPAASFPLAGSPFEVPAHGYIRHLFVHVQATGGVAGTLAADGPWSAIQEIALMDVNGAPIFGPLSGYQAFLANLFGGYSFHQDPRQSPDYSESPTAFQFTLRIPVEINHNNGLGALGNQNAAAAYRARIVMAPNAAIWSALPTTFPAIRVRAWLEAWTQPTETDLAGRPQAQAPPRHGTTQFWSVQTIGVAAGQQQPRLARMGNLIRTIVLVGRTAAGVRDNTIIPDPLTVSWDARELLNAPRVLLRQYMAERYLYATGGIPTGVIALPFTHDMLGHAGDGTAELWIPTVQATRMELRGSNFVAGNVEVLVNDIQPVEVQPEDRYEMFSETGFTPEVGVPVRTG